MSFPVMTFDAAILYDTPFRIPDYQALLGEVNQRLGRAGNGVAMTNLQAEGGVVFRSDNLYVAISFNRTRLPAEGFQAALNAGVNRMRNERFGHWVEDHIEHVFVTVGDGKLPMVPAMRELMQAAGMAQTVEAVDPRVKISVLHSVVEAIVETIMPTPTVVHWCDTDLLYTAYDFPPVTPALPFPVSLTAQPQFFDTGLTPDGRQTHGIVMRRSELLCGRTLFADTTTYDPNAILAAMQVIMLGHIIGARMLEDGVVGSFDERTAFRLEFRPPDPMTPAGGICMLIGPAEALQARATAAAQTGGAGRKGWWPFGKKRTLH